MKKIEQLPPSNWHKNLEKRIKALELYLETLRKHEKLDGRIRISKKHKTAQYYYVTKNGPKTGKYIPCSEINFVKQVAQSNFETKFSLKIKQEINFLRTIQKNYELIKAENYFNQLSQERKKLITPATLLDADYAKIWQSTVYKGKIFYKDQQSFYTLSGLKVRSKSEVIIAHALEQAGIPFRYEYPVKLNKTVYPDFYCLNLQTRQEFIWEHIGELDNTEYMQKNMIKFRMYTKYGYLLGKNLIITYETSTFPLDPLEVKQKIDAYLK